MVFGYTKCDDITFLYHKLNNIFACLWQFDYAVRVLQNSSSTNKNAVTSIFIYLFMVRLISGTWVCGTTCSNFL
jgi:hypothetical protein